MLCRIPAMESVSPTVRSANVWISNHAFVILPPKTVVGFGEPVGKMSFVVARRWESVV